MAYAIYLVLFVKDNRLIVLLQLIYVTSGLFDIGWLFFGLEQFKLTVARNTLIKISTVVLMFVFVHKPSDLWKYTLIMSAGTLFSQAYLWLYVKKYVSFEKCSVKEITSNIKPVLILFIPVLAYSMAAGIGSRFGTGIKQLEPVDDAGHIIMDYSIHDAIEAGFNHVVFIIRKDIEKEFKEVIGDRIASICSSHNVTVDYAFQDINDIPGTLPEGRTKPWGTGQAVLAAKKVIKTPFIVINADDYYGKEGFKAVHEYLVNGGKSCMAGFVLKNTLSDNGGVTRGICKMDEQNNLTEVVETKNIVKTVTGADADGVAVDVNSLVSMNMWGLTPDFLDVLEKGFKEFFEKEVPGNPQKAEYLIPIFIGELLEQGKMSVKVLKTNDTWYGMTYHEDVAAVKDSFKKMLENGVHKADLFSDL